MRTAEKEPRMEAAADPWCSVCQRETQAAQLDWITNQASVHKAPPPNAFDVRWFLAVCLIAN